MTLGDLIKPRSLVLWKLNSFETSSIDLSAELDAYAHIIEDHSLAIVIAVHCHTGDDYKRAIVLIGDKLGWMPLRSLQSLGVTYG